MILPTITSISYDVVGAIPREMRTGSLALGSTRWQTIRHVLLPAAKTGLLTAVILGMMRAAGEALAVQMVIGNRQVMPVALSQPITTLTSEITLDMGNTVTGEPWNEALWTMGLILLVISFAFVLFVRWLGSRGGRPGDCRSGHWPRRARHILSTASRPAFSGRSALRRLRPGRDHRPLPARLDRHPVDRLSVRRPSRTERGWLGPILWNSVYILVLTLLITVPLGLDRRDLHVRVRRRWPAPEPHPALSQELISSVPSIVVGLFGLALFVTAFGWGFRALSGALALTVFNLPLMTRLAEQAMRAVPQDERDASLALGSTKWQTIRHVVVPLAVPGIITGIILTSGRVFGEAAALLFTAGLSTPSALRLLELRPDRPAFAIESPSTPATTLSVYIWKLNSRA